MWTDAAIFVWLVVLSLVMVWMFRRFDRRP